MQQDDVPTLEPRDIKLLVTAAISVNAVAFWLLLGLRSIAGWPIFIGLLLAHTVLTCCLVGLRTVREMMLSPRRWNELGAVFGAYFVGPLLWRHRSQKKRR